MAAPPRHPSSGNAEVSRPTWHDPSLRPESFAPGHRPAHRKRDLRPGGQRIVACQCGEWIRAERMTAGSFSVRPWILLEYGPRAHGLERVEQASPAHGAWMQKCVPVCKKPLANLTRLPGVRARIQRHINHDRGADNILSRDATPEPAVVRISSVITHRKITVVRNQVRQFHASLSGKGPLRRRWLGGPCRVVFV